MLGVTYTIMVETRVIMKCYLKNAAKETMLTCLYSIHRGLIHCALGLKQAFMEISF